MKIHTSNYRATQLFSAIALALLTAQTAYATTQTANTTSESAEGEDGSIPHTDPYIINSLSAGETISTELKYTQANAVDAEGNPGISLKDRYLVGVGVSEDITGDLFGEDGSISISNDRDSSGTIAVGIGGAQIDSIDGDITASGVYEVRGLGFSGEKFAPSGTGSSIGTYTGTINVSTTAGSATGIDAEYGSLGKVDGAHISVSATHGGDVTGISVAAGATVGKSGGIHAHISTTSAGGASFIYAEDPSTLGVISGNFTMNTNNSYTTDSWILNNTFSAGYVVGYDKSATSSSVGFATTRENPIEGGMPENISDSLGFLIDWSNTSMTIHRNYGLAAGAAVFDRSGEDFGAEMTALFQQTTFGAGCEFNISVTSGMAAGAWINGVDVSLGALLGTINATADTGSAVGIFTTGTDLLNSALVTQSTLDTKLGHISGNINATVKSAAVNNKAIGLQLGNVGSEEYNTTVEKLSGNITASMHNVSATSNAPTEFRYDGSSVLDTDTITAGIIDLGRQTLNFNADASPEDGDAAGSSVRALVYSDSGKTLTDYGQAIATLKGGITVNSIGKTNNAITFEGNLTAGELGDQSITFQSGRYNVISEVWNAHAGITFGTKANTAEGLHDVARVTLSDIAETVGTTTTLYASTLNFTANNNDSTSQLLIAAGHDLDLSGLTEVNIYLTGSEESYDGPLYFVDARQAINFELGDEDMVYNIYFNGSTTAYEQHDSFKIVHDETGIYLHVPEPTTVTLSFLALTGLIARRRRQA